MRVGVKPAAWMSLSTKAIVVSRQVFSSCARYRGSRGKHIVTIHEDIRRDRDRLADDAFGGKPPRIHRGCHRLDDYP